MQAGVVLLALSGCRRGCAPMAASAGSEVRRWRPVFMLYPEFTLAAKGSARDLLTAVTPQGKERSRGRIPEPQH